jgi:hypothetical protein
MKLLESRTQLSYRILHERHRLLAAECKPLTFTGNHTISQAPCLQDVIELKLMMAWPWLLG